MAIPGRATTSSMRWYSMDGNDADVGAPGAQVLRALRRHGKRKIVLARQRPVRKAPDQRRGIQEFHDGDAQFAHIRRCQGTIEYSIAAGGVPHARNVRSASLAFSTGMNMKLDFQVYIAAANPLRALRKMCNRFLERTA